MDLLIRLFIYPPREQRFIQSLFLFRDLNMALYGENQKEEFEMKTLRIIHLVVTFVVFFPLLVAVSFIWLFVCLRAAHIAEMPKKEGFKAWFNYIKFGIEMNKDFVLNGL